VFDPKFREDDTNDNVLLMADIESITAGSSSPSIYYSYTDFDKLSSNYLRVDGSPFQSGKKVQQTIT